MIDLQTYPDALTGTLDARPGFSFDHAEGSFIGLAYGVSFEPKTIRVNVPRNFPYRRIFCGIGGYPQPYYSGGVRSAAMAIKKTLTFYQGSAVIGKIESNAFFNDSLGNAPILNQSMPDILMYAASSYGGTQTPGMVCFYEVSTQNILNADGGITSTEYPSKWYCQPIELYGIFDAVELKLDAPTYLVAGGYGTTRAALNYDMNLAILSQNVPNSNANT